MAVLGHLYATVSPDSSTNSAILISNDQGLTWTRTTFGLPASWKKFSLQRVLPKAFYFFAAPADIDRKTPGLYRSVDGKTAQKMHLDIGYGDWVDVQEDKGGAIYVVTQTAIHRSRDMGKTWQKLSRSGIDS